MSPRGGQEKKVGAKGDRFFYHHDKMEKVNLSPFRSSFRLLPTCVHLPSDQQVSHIE